ncbi:Tricarboxylate transport sensor protein TctE [Caenispirillum salinarum AK4]|uniref:histidine kinase n=1 Tax=Caenispirillum salinarum AK4 TaxID=1238182 RepID=K9HNC0_9PROT|nr:sensor histidine kinase [Caenispirillum salinarum]EKV31828.1 Tricarboxylate transport sensor protein TctE [Caenispirillum salinarum AK4]
MTGRRHSLRRSLFGWVLVPLVGLSLVFALEGYADARHQANRAFDRTLAGSALTMADRVAIADDGGLQVDIPYVALEMLTSLAEERVFYQVRNPVDGFVTGYQDLPPPPDEPAVGGGPVFYDATYRGAPIRAVALAGAASDAARSVGYTVIVAETTQARESLARAALARLSLRLTILVGIVSLMVWLGIRRGLAPLARLEKAVARRNPDDLRPLRRNIPAETERLVDAFNAFMGRLADALGSLRRFTGNVGHQLRTPLAVARGNLALAARATDRAEMAEHLRKADAATREAERLVEQFLLLARLEESRASGEGMQRLDLAEVAEEAALDRADQALRAGLDMSLEKPAAPVLVKGNAILLREVVLNLIDNAIRHAAPGPLRIALKAAGDTVELAVSDAGPGIPADKRALVLSRFGRTGDGGSGGYGLGLAICREIADAHGGALRLDPGPGGHGLRVSLQLPRDADPAVR